MNKTELSQKIADSVGITKAQAESALTALTDIATAEMKAGGEVVLTGFGTFSARARKGREGINPRNPQEKIAIPTVVVAKFKAGKNLKDALKGKVKATPASAPAPVVEPELATPAPNEPNQE